MTRRTQIIWWVAALALAIGLLWTIGGALAPYITAAVLAYLLTPLADRMERGGVPRVIAAFLIVGVVVIVLALLVVLGVPMAIRQTQAFVTALPEYIETLLEWIEARAPNLVGGRAMMRDALQAGEEAVREHGMTVVTGILVQTMRIVDVVIFVVILPIVAFFLILGWHDMLASINALLPRRQAPTIRRLAHDIDEVLGGFVRGQFIVATMMTVYYSAALTWAGLSYALAVGVVAGIGTLVPIVGATVGAVLAVGIAIFQFWGDFTAIALVAGVYFGGQLVESNIVTPRLVGRHVRLHPVWLLLAFSVFATLLGFVGVLIAVPVAAVIGVLVRYAVEQYMGSDLHDGVPVEKPILDATGRPIETRE